MASTSWVRTSWHGPTEARYSRAPGTSAEYRPRQRGSTVSTTAERCVPAVPNLRSAFSAFSNRPSGLKPLRLVRRLRRSETKLALAGPVWARYRVNASRVAYGVGVGVSVTGHSLRFVRVVRTYILIDRHK